MLGKTHMAVGIAGTLAVTKPQNLKELILAVGIGAFGSVISDIDSGTSESHREADKIELLSFFTIAAVLGLDYYYHTEIVKTVIQSSGYGRIVCGILMFIIICCFGKEQPHRSFMHSFLALALLEAAIALIWKEAMLYFAVGFLSHLAVDLFNKRKVRIFYPRKPGVSLGLFRSDGFMNDMFFLGGGLVAFMELRELVMKIFLNRS